MNIKKFEKLSYYLSILLRFVSIIIFTTSLWGLLVVIFNRNSITIESLDLSFLFVSIYTGNVTESSKFIAGITIGMISSFTYFYTFLRGSHFFSDLSKGNTPFSITNYKLLKKIGLVLAVTSFATPFIYSLILTLNAPKGYYIHLGIDNTTIIGLIIYGMAEVIRYGVTLQSLADETV